MSPISALTRGAVVLLWIFSGWTQAQLSWNLQEIPGGSQEIQAICQDQKGFLWVGTQTVLYRFDGSNWVSYLREDSTMAQVTALGEDREGTLWVGYEDGGVFTVRVPEEKLTRHPTDSLRSAVTAFLFHPGGEVFIATYGQGLWRLGSRPAQWGLSQGLPGNDLYDACLDPLGRIWVGTDQGIGILTYTDGRMDITRLGAEQGLPDEIVTALTLGAGKIWIGMYDLGLASYDLERDSLAIHPGWNGAAVTEIWPTEGETWVGSSIPGLWSWDGQGYHGFDLEVRAQAICIDQEGLLWVGGETGQLLHTPVFLRHFQESMGEIRTLSLAQDAFWIGTRNGLHRYDPQKDRLQHIPLPGAFNLSALYEDRWGYVWIGTMGKGVWRYHPTTQRFSQVPTDLPVNTPVLSIACNAREIWIGTFGGALQGRFLLHGDLKQGRLTTPEEAREMNYIYQVLAAGADEFWFATDGKGLGHYSPGQFQLSPIEEAAALYSLTLDEEGRLWIGTEKGKILPYSPTNVGQQVPSPPFEGMENLQGIISLPGEGFCLIAESGFSVWSPGNPSLAPFDQIARLPSPSSFLNVYVVSPDGAVWLGTQQGLLKYLPDRHPRQAFPQPQITRVMVNLEPVPLSTDLLKLPYDQNHLAIEYTAAWFQSPEGLSYQHKLVGHDLAWIDSKNPRAIYPDLNPGTYTFQLRAGQGGNFSQASPLRYKVEVLRPFWQTTAFFLAVAALTLTLVYLVLRQREHRLQQQQAAEKQEIQYQFDTLRNQINPHFLFNSFTTLIGIIEEQPPEKAVAYVEQLSDFFRNILDYREKSTIALVEELQLLETYVTLQKERYQDTFFIDIDIPPGYAAFQIAPLTLQLLVENALKHNLATLQHPLRVSVEVAGELLVIKNTLQLRKNVPSSTGIGLSNIQARYAILSPVPVAIFRTDTVFEVHIPLLKPTSHASADHRR